MQNILTTLCNNLDNMYVDKQPHLPPIATTPTLYWPIFLLDLLTDPPVNFKLFVYVEPIMFWSVLKRLKLLSTYQRYLLAHNKFAKLLVYEITLYSALNNAT